MATRPSKAVLDYQVKQAVNHPFGDNEADFINICERAIARNYHRLWVIALRDEFGFGKDRLTRALEKVIELSNDLSDKRFNFDDIADVIKDETGLEV